MTILLLKQYIFHILILIWIMQILHGQVCMHWNWKEFIWNKNMHYALYLAKTNELIQNLLFFFWKPQCIEFILNKHYQHLNFMHKLSLIKSRQYSLISWKDDINNKEEKGIQSYSFFQKKIKSKLIVIENETGYF